MHLSDETLNPAGLQPLPTVVIATRNRRERLLGTLGRLCSLPDRPAIVVVDNASEDGTAAAVSRAYPGVRLIEATDEIGSAARTLGVRAAETPLVAFSDDDSWWAPGALRTAVQVFEEYPRLALIAARIVVEPRGTLDPTCEGMRDSPLSAELPLPGPAVLGFMACGAVARRSAVLSCSGFHPRYGFGGEEHLLAVDMAAAGWGLAYVDDVVAHHQPAPGPRAWRGTTEVRNRLWSAWLRRPLPTAVRLTIVTMVRRSGGGRALLAALPGLPWIARERRVVPARVEVALRALDVER
jgi:N-acetylglucosaminyl-diphospho-decaprenol L-rhamnosyltransferase